MHNSHICYPTKPVSHKAQLMSLQGQVPSTNLNSSLHFIHVPYSDVKHSSHEYSKQVEFQQFIILFEKRNINMKKYKIIFIFLFIN